MFADSMVVEKRLTVAAIAGTPVLACATIFVYRKCTHDIYAEVRSWYPRYFSILVSIMGAVDGRRALLSWGLFLVRRDFSY